jgi:hypothetical protein
MYIQILVLQSNFSKKYFLMIKTILNFITKYKLMTKFLTYSIVTCQSLFRQAFIILSLILLEQFSSLAQPNLFGPQNIITESGDGASFVYASDLDGDGDQDVISATYDDDKIAWYENDGNGGYSIQNVISDQCNGAICTFSYDLDGDGDQDVLSASFLDNKVAWYENNGYGDFGVQNIISTQIYGAKSVFATDLDGDEDPDVISASIGDGLISWFENDGDGNFGEQNIIAQIAMITSVYVNDLDEDGDQDIISSSYDQDPIEWYENNGDASSWTYYIIAQEADEARSVFASDIDNDGDSDVLSASSGDNKIAWYKNIGDGVFEVQQIISTQAFGASSVFAADLDGDGHQDVLSSSFNDGKIIWYENDGFGNFGPQNIVSSLANGVRCVYSIDLNMDGDQDILSASLFDDKIAFYENLHAPNSEFSTQECILKGQVSVIINKSNFINDTTTTFYWTLDNQVISNSQDLENFEFLPGTNNLSLITCTTTGCDTTTKPINVLAFELDSIPVLLTNIPYTFTNTSINIGYWVWEFGDGGIEEIQTPTHTYSEPGIYELEVNIYNTEIAEDCFFQMEYSVTVVGSPTGLDELPSNSLIVHPNPADQCLFLSSPELVPGAVFRLYNLLGQELITHRMDSSEEIAIPSGELSEGIYFFKLSSSEVVHKIVVAH